MRAVPAMLLLLLATEPFRIPSDPGLYYLEPQGAVRIEGRAVSIAHSRSHVPMSGSLPMPMKGTAVRAEILGGHAEHKVASAPVFYYRVESGHEATGAGDLVLVKLQVKHNHREFEVSSEAEWQSSSGIPLRSQVEFSSRQVESSVYKLVPADDLDPGEYGFYLFRGRDLPGFLYDFSVPE